MPTLHVIYDPSDLDLRGVPHDMAQKRLIRQAKLSIPDGVFDEADIEQTIRSLVNLIRLGPAACEVSR